MGFKRFWRQWHNKILATTFIVLAILCYIGNILVDEIIYNWTYFRSDPYSIWNVVVYLLVYGIIFYGNAKNNNVAYSGILMFVFMLALGVIIDIIQAFISSSFNVITIISCGFIVPVAVIGILLYINISKYISYRSDNFKLLRIFGIIFAGLLVAECVPFLIFFGPLSCLVQVSEAACAISSIFTVERIKRN